VTSGIEVDAGAHGEFETRRFVAGPARDFSLIADDDYVALEATSGDTIVRAHVSPGQETAGQTALDVAVSALDLYGSWFGPYPYQELDIIAAPLAGALGVSWSGIIYLDGPGLLGVLAPNDPVRFSSIVAHEVGHQWWGSLVGFNSNDHTFLLEGLTNYVSILWIEATSGRDAAIAALRASLAAPYVALLQASGDQVADLPIAEGQTGRSTIAYAKSSLGFFAIDETIGDDAFRTALADLTTDFGFGIAEPVDVEAALEAASGQELDELWRFWFEAAETTPADVEALFA
jgi:aminopeptidase N